MARYDYYRGARDKGYLLDRQSDWLDEFGSRVAIPLMPVKGTKTVSRLNPVCENDGQPNIMSTQLLFAIPVERLGPQWGSLNVEHHTIIVALDTLFGTY